MTGRKYSNLNKKKIDKLYSFKVMNFSSKDTIKGNGRGNHRMRNGIWTHFNWYRSDFQNVHKKRDNPIENGQKDLEQVFYNWDHPNGQLFMKRCKASLVIRGIANKTHSDITSCPPVQLKIERWIITWSNGSTETPLTGI